MTISNAHQFSFKDINGNKSINLSDLKGKVVLIVNTASKCGFTPQYKSLENLYSKYKDKGLEIIAVPSADFGNQEFPINSKVQEFTDKEFNITFPISTISKVKGKDAHPFYIWANNQSGFIGSPKWNFHKYLIDKQGNFASWFSSGTNPGSKKMINKIEELLLENNLANDNEAQNVLGTNLEPCCFEPITGYYRDGYCNTDHNDQGRHTICAIMTDEFLEFSKKMGNDLITANPEYNFPGLKEGDKWCLCALRWKEAFDNNVAPKVILESTHKKSLEYVDIENLKINAL
jgi:glutathione peroxidase